MDNVAKSLPDFENLLELIESRIEAIEGKAQFIKTKLNSIKSMDENSAKPDEPGLKESSTFIDRMMVNINRLSGVNGILGQCSDHLESIVG